ncbi:hypothetical protein H4R21_007005, partial [Coemansia helicoidea]
CTFILDAMDTGDKRFANIQTPHRQAIEISKLTLGKGKQNRDNKPQTLADVQSTSAEHDAKINFTLDAMGAMDKRLEDMYALHAKVAELSNLVSGSGKLFRGATTSFTKSVAGLSKELILASCSAD